MTTNRTSQATAELPAFMDGLAKIRVWSYDQDPEGPKVARAIAAKYQRMEMALMEIAGYDETGIPTFLPVETAQEALAFDPLSPSTK